ncbi:MAG: PilZ domain-containing protein [Pseudomonadota bacterium]
MTESGGRGALIAAALEPGRGNGYSLASSAHKECDMAMPEERRTAPRLLRDENVVVKILVAPAQPELVGTKVECSTVDVSASGLRLLLETPVETGSQLGLEVDLTEHSDRYFLGGEVMWSRETEAAGIYLIGVQLLGEDTPALQQWRSLFI